MPTTNTTVSTPFANIEVRQSAGLGMPVVMIHGSGSSKDVFAKQFDSPLADAYRLIALDLPGHGQSSNARDPAHTYTVTGLAEVVQTVLSQLEVDRGAIYGWSLGGHVGMQMLGTWRGMTGLMLSGAPPISPGPLGLLRGFHARWDMLLASKEIFTARDTERFARLSFGDQVAPAFLEAIMRADGRIRVHFNRSLMGGAGADQRASVENAAIPIAMINGAEDAIVRLGYIAGLHYRTLWDDTCHVIAGAGHAPFWQSPDVFNLLFTRFLADISALKSREERDAVPMARQA